MPISRAAVVGVLILVPVLGVASSPQAVQDGRQVDLASKGDLTGDGRLFRVEWYHRAAPDSAGTPAYVLGVSIRSPSENAPVLAQWEASQPAGIAAPDPVLDDLWPIPESGGGRLISVRISYTNRLADLTILRFDGRKLRVVGHWQEGAFRITRLGPDKRLAVIQMGSPGNFPTIYAWNGTDFKDASREFPDYYASWATPLMREIRNAEPALADTVASNCHLVARALDYAGAPQVGRQACVEARKRISSGWALIPGQEGESVQDFERERNSAIEAINRVLGGSSKQQAARAPGP